MSGPSCDLSAQALPPQALSAQKPSRRPVAVVTGAGRGLGRAIAIELAGAGYDLVLGYWKSKAAARAVASEVEDKGSRALVVGGDVADPGTCAQLADAATSVLGGLSVWVNNAGISVLAPVLSTTLTQVQRMSEVNFFGVFNGLQAAARAMVAAGGGRIVNVASDLGLKAAPLLAGYSATKFAVVGLTQAAALELAPLGITVNAICPGTVETDMVLAEEKAEAAIFSTTAEEVRKRILSAVPAGRLCQPEDVAGLVAYLVSPAAAYLTGEAICINGGSVIH